MDLRESPMIYTVTLNPAVDRELTVAEMQFDIVLRASESRVDFGGKGFNVSRLLMQMATTSTAIGFVGGRAGDLLRVGLQGLGIQTDFVQIPGETRTNISIVTTAHDHYIKVNEHGPTVDDAKQEDLLSKIKTLARGGDWWVLAGSLPPGIAPDYYGRIVNIINMNGAHAILDTAGDALRFGCRQGPYLVKPNAEELHGITGWPTTTPIEIAAAATELQRMGVQNIVVSMGKAGALLKAPEGAWLAHSPGIKESNPIGAGDSMVGGLVWGLAEGMALREALKWGVASGAATASLRGTEVGSKRLIQELVSQVRLVKLST